jgi:hypothetical protein
MKIKHLIIAVMSLAVMSLSACGGGGGETPASNPADNPTVPANGTTNPVPTPTPTKGLLKLSTSGAAAIMAGVDVTVSLPDGVILNADPATGEVAAGTITVSGAAAAGSNNIAAAKFTPASGGVPANLHIAIINVSGFSLGEFATIRFGLATGAALPLPNAFTVTSFSAKALDGSPLSGVTAAPPSVQGI